MDDPFIARSVVLVLALVALLCIGGVIYLIATDHAAPDVLVGTLGVAVGALAGVLAPRGS